MKILLPAGAPSWLVNVLGEIEQMFLPVTPTQPIKLKSYDSSSAAGLPDPTKWSNSIIWISNLNTAAISNGVHWYPVTLGAHL